jgi:hypothetical protein
VRYCLLPSAPGTKDRLKIKVCRLSKTTTPRPAIDTILRLSAESGLTIWPCLIDADFGLGIVDEDGFIVSV